jgi:hypothetical protein
VYFTQAVLVAVLPVRAVASDTKTYYVASTGTDAASGSADAPFHSLAKAWQVAISGDTIVVCDGLYSNASPPPGKSGLLRHPITIRAENPGRARIDRLLLKGNSHLSFVGLRIEGGQYAVAVGSDGPGRPSHHVSFQQIGFSCRPGTLNDGACFGLADGTHHVVLEDSWGWGGGRYTVKCYGGPGGKLPNLTCDHNIFRRLVLRQGPAKSGPGKPQASLALYYASNNIVENVIALDGLAASDSSNAAFYVTAHEPPPHSSRNRFLGLIALGNMGAGLWVDCPGATCNDIEVRSSIFWGSSGHGIAIAGGTCSGIVIDRNTMAATLGEAHGFVNHRCDGAVFTNNALLGNAGFGARQSPGGGSTTVVHHNGYFANRAGPRSAIAAGIGDLNSSPEIIHLPRLEARSLYRNAGSGGDIGATVMRRWEGGVLTDLAIWPWPNEVRLQSELCHEVGARGFCASGKSLTRYVWEFLGTPLPAGIYR